MGGRRGREARTKIKRHSQALVDDGDMEGSEYRNTENKIEQTPP